MFHRKGLSSKESNTRVVIAPTHNHNNNPSNLPPPSTAQQKNIIGTLSSSVVAHDATGEATKKRCRRRLRQSN